MAGAETLGSVLLWGKVFRFVQLCFGTNHKRRRQLVENTIFLKLAEGESMGKIEQILLLSNFILIFLKCSTFVGSILGQYLKCPRGFFLAATKNLSLCS